MVRHWLWLCVLTLAVGVSGNVIAQGPPGGFGRGGGGFDSSLMLLRDENVIKELEIVEGQQEKLRALGDKAREEMGSLFSGMRDASPEEREKRFAEIQDKLKAKQEELKKQVDEILLPQQRDRLKQLAIQSRLRFQSTGDAISSGDVADALKLTDEQKEQLKEKQKTVEEEYRKEAEALRNKYRDKVLEVLTPEQKAKWKELVGNSFEFAPQQFGRRGGSGGGPGGDRGGPPPGGSSNN
jgi:Spy/CpxP family protein refolding chaperone